MLTLEQHLQAIVTVLSLVNPLICGTMFAQIDAGQMRVRIFEAWALFGEVPSDVRRDTHSVAAPIGPAPFGPGLPHSALENSISCWTGTETTLGDPHGVGIRISPNGVARFCVITVLMTAATRPSQSNTGAPEAP